MPHPQMEVLYVMLPIIGAFIVLFSACCCAHKMRKFLSWPKQLGYHPDHSSSSEYSAAARNVEISYQHNMAHSRLAEPENSTLHIQTMPTHMVLRGAAERMVLLESHISDIEDIDIDDDGEKTNISLHQNHYHHRHPSGDDKELVKTDVSSISSMASGVSHIIDVPADVHHAQLSTSGNSAVSLPAHFGASGSSDNSLPLIDPQVSSVDLQVPSLNPQIQLIDPQIPPTSDPQVQLIDPKVPSSDAVDPQLPSKDLQVLPLDPPVSSPDSLAPSLDLQSSPMDLQTPSTDSQKNTVL